MDLVHIDVALRGAATGLFMILAVSIWASRIAREAQIAFSLNALATCARLWSTLPTDIALSPDILVILRSIGAFGPIAMTWFALTIFLDNKRFTLVWIGSGTIITALILLTIKWPVLIPYARSYAVVHFIGLLAIVLYSGLDDLQDARRRLRPAMATFLFTYCIGLALTSRPIRPTQDVSAALLQSGGLMFFLFFFALWALKANLNDWPGETTPPAPSEPSRAERSSAQSALVRRLLQEMENGVWRNEGLTVAGLAQKVGAPEHQVRKAINQVLGFRNFASFINSARIDAAKARLASRDAVEITILEVAFDVGFSSIGPFNRAFRQATGQSPTNFRKAAFDDGES